MCGRPAAQLPERTPLRSTLSRPASGVSRSIPIYRSFNYPGSPTGSLKGTPNMANPRRGLRHQDLHHGPGGVALHKSNWNKERVECARFVDLNLTHPGIALAVKWLDTQLQRGSARDDHQLAWKQFLRLWQAGITGKDILVECTALWLWWIRTGRPTNDLKLTMALSHAVLKLCPYRKSVLDNGKVRTLTPSYGLVGQLGKHLRGNLYQLISATAEHINERDSLTKPAQIAALKTPFPTTTNSDQST